MATIDELQTAVAAVNDAASNLLAKAQAADQVVVPDFQPEVDSLTATASAINSYLNPVPVEPTP